MHVDIVHCHYFLYISQKTFLVSCYPQKKWSFQRKPEITIRTIMSAILLSAGPISTHYAVRRYGPKSLRTPSIPKELYLIAANSLEAANLGTLVTVKHVTGLSDTFIKKTPQDIEEDLKANIDLGSLEDYTLRFRAPPPACITPAMQASLIHHGLVPKGSFASKPEKIYPIQPTTLHYNMLGAMAQTQEQHNAPISSQGGVLDVSGTQGIQGGLSQSQGIQGDLSQPQGIQGGLSHPQGIQGGLSQSQGIQGSLSHPQGIQGGLSQPQGIQGGLSQSQVTQGGLSQPQGTQPDLITDDPSSNGAQAELFGTPPSISPSSNLHVANTECTDVVDK